MSAGFIYILTNPSFPEYIKIGYADNVENRLQQLNNSECIPFAFRVYATYEVDKRLSDLNLHAIIDKLNPNLRSIDTFNGKQRIREFYAMSPTDAYEILEAIAQINDRADRLKKWDMTPTDKQAEEIAEDVKLAVKERASNYTFNYWQIPVGATLVYVDDPSVAVRVVSDRKVEYHGDTMFMTPFVQLITGNNKLLHGPGYVARHFTYNGELIKDIETRLHSQE